jgi:multiple sugar transport system substrate-binding protein
MKRTRPFAAAPSAAFTRRGFLGFAGGVAATTLLTACSSGPSGSSASSGGTTTIKIVEYQQARADIMKKLIPQFEKDMAAQGKKIKVDLIADILTDAQFKTKITQQFHSGTAPDLIDTGATNIAGYAGAGYLLELDDALHEWSGWKTFYPTVKKVMKQPDGHYYAIPHEASVQSLFYRKDVLESMGISTSQPKTWDELIGRLKKVTVKTGEPSIVIPAGTAWGGGTWSEGFLPIVAGTGSTFYDAKTGKWKVESKGLTATFELYSELVDNKLLPVQDLLNPNPWEPTKYVDFVKGTLPVSAQGTWGWRYDWGPDGAAPIKDVQEKVATWDYPSLIDGTEPYSVGGGGYVYAVNAKSKSPDAAIAFAQWLASGKPLARQLVKTGAAAPRSGISGIEPYKSEPTLLDAEAKLKTSVPAPVGDGADQVSQAVQDATEKILTGDANGKQAAKSFAADAASLLGNSLVAQ